ncbi:hypothetical protein T440DRAFT_81871 [Plenodomus tracheiphilus IPT5]|uniref:Uncharacterized protein n=1 Tax=Plenodomus tracheiphilus IPT5 TaxID=1408161 RepID=A0A6A7B5T2_9PLEO|nr:hypothetical protein T440DRAFT_81871 [Plenodomus tracheiphilus IPT5]
MMNTGGAAQNHDSDMAYAKREQGQMIGRHGGGVHALIGLWLQRRSTVCLLMRRREPSSLLRPSRAPSGMDGWMDGWMVVAVRLGCFASWTHLAHPHHHHHLAHTSGTHESQAIARALSNKHLRELGRGGAFGGGSVPCAFETLNGGEAHGWGGGPCAGCSHCAGGRSRTRSELVRRVQFNNSYNVVTRTVPLVTAFGEREMGPVLVNKCARRLLSHCLAALLWDVMERSASSLRRSRRRQRVTTGHHRHSTASPGPDSHRNCLPTVYLVAGYVVRRPLSMLQRGVRTDRAIYRAGRNA